ncbi:MAG TPA: chemotaxis protein CheX [Polyangiaceae bacterium]|nr:chemotaxis protein CheX [Polyangiaceae bacterium]
MKTDKAVLVVDPAAGALSGVMEELDELGFRVVWVPSLSAALDFLSSHPRLSLIIASAAAGEKGGLEFMGRVKEIAPEVRIIWGARPDQPKGPTPSRLATGPDSIIPEPFASDELRNVVSELLAEHFYPTSVAQAVKTAALEVLGTVRPFTVEGGAFLVANQSALSDLSAVIPFSGGVSGHLMVGMTRPHAEVLHRVMLPGVRSVRLERLEDLVGELCNQILGRINAFFATHAVSVQHGTPIFIRAPGSTFRYAGRQPSFAVTLVEPQDHARLDLEYYLADLPREALTSPEPNNVLALDEIRYL